MQRWMRWPVGLMLLALATVATAVELPDFTQLIAANRAAVVSIDSRSGETAPDNPLDQLPLPKNSPYRDFFKRFFKDHPQQDQPAPAAVGSGFIISSDGYILTNAHVVKDRHSITAVMSDRSEYRARLIGSDPRTDIALLKIDAHDLPVVHIGDASTLKVGQWVLAIGSPFGFDYTATQGIISGLGRSLPGANYVPFIQTDAAVNPGNSGGPLFNLAGKVIGINSQIYSRTGGYEGLSFAIPIDVAMAVVKQLQAGGKAVYGWLGVVIQDVTTPLAHTLGLQRPQGALVTQVLPTSPAARSGVKPGDVIISFDGKAVATSSALPPMVGRIKPGSAATLTIIRDGKRQQLHLTIEPLPGNPQALLEAPAAKPQPDIKRLGLVVAPVAAGQPDGVLVKRVAPGPAAAAGIQAGDIITMLDRQPIKNTAGLKRIAAALPAGKPISILVRRGNSSLFLALILAPKQ